MDNLNCQIKNLPLSSGIYLMKDSSGKIIYVGKAKNIKKRVSSYFKNPADLHIKIQHLVKNIVTIDYVLTKTEKEAFILENRFIKQHNPKYNTRLKDSKTYPYLKIDIKDAFPRLLKTRIRANDGAWYFGPYVGERYLSFVMDVIKDHFNLRRCKTMKKKPCLYYHMQGCYAPCVGLISKEEYKALLTEVKLLLEGKFKNLNEDIKRRMLQASEHLEFEKAQKYKNQLEAIKMLEEKQFVEKLGNSPSCDFFLVIKFGEHHILQVFRIRDGYLSQVFSYEVEAGTEENGLLTSGILQFYEDHEFSKEIIVEETVTDKDFLDYFQDNKVKVKLATLEENQEIMNMLRQNAYHTLSRKLIFKEEFNYDELLLGLKHDLGLKKKPNKIIGVDISHLGGENIVASMVCFVNGVPDKNSYRKFNIKTVKYNDDFASIKEVVSRIFKKRSLYNPDLVLIDGGLGQLGYAMKALEELGEKDQDILALAKKEEIIYLPNSKEGVKLKSDGLKILQQVRDEAHRFAISFQRSKRTKILK